MPNRHRSTHIWPRRGWMVIASPRQRDPLLIAQKAGWASWLVWVGPENLASTGVRTTDRPARINVVLITADHTLTSWQFGRWGGQRLVYLWGKTCLLYRFITCESSLFLGCNILYLRPVSSAEHGTWFQLVKFWTANPVNSEALNDTLRERQSYRRVY